MSDSHDLCKKKACLLITLHDAFINLLESDLWELPHARLTGTITDTIEASFFSRCEPEKRPHHLREKLGGLEGVSNGSPSTKEEDEAYSIDGNEMVDADRPYSKWYNTCFRRKKAAGTPKYDASLTKTLHHTFFSQIWMAGILKLFSGELVLSLIVIVL